MTTLINGMISVDFITALNANFMEICGADNFTDITDAMQGSTLEATLNTNLQNGYSFVGVRGITILNLLNTEFDPAYIHIKINPEGV